MFEEDDETQAVVLLGEVGGTMEQRAASFIRAHMTKPVVALIVGRAAPEGAQMGHAGAIIEGEEQTAASKIQALRDAGARIAHRPADIPLRIRELGVV
jgi:succinyl-CoA synthetase alpha subunit